MRIHEGGFAYDIEQIRDPLTQLPLQWEIHPLPPPPERRIVLTGEAKNRPEAERKARAALSKRRSKDRAA